MVWASVVRNDCYDKRVTNFPGKIFPTDRAPSFAQYRWTTIRVFLLYCSRYIYLYTRYIDTYKAIAFGLVIGFCALFFCFFLLFSDMSFGWGVICIARQATAVFRIGHRVFALVFVFLPKQVFWMRHDIACQATYSIDRSFRVGHRVLLLFSFFSKQVLGLGII